MNSRLENSFPWTLVLLIIAFAGSSNGNSISTVSPSDIANTETPNGPIGNSASVVVPQVGFLEERADIVRNGGAALSNGDAANGILVPIVSVPDAHGSPIKSASPLVALLPAPPSAIGKSTDPAEIPVISNLPILPPYDQLQPPVRPEIRRFLRHAAVNAARARAPYDDDSSESLDVAEDIVFRPLFRIRQNPDRNSAYWSGNSLRRKNALNYRRYNVNGYYRFPYNYARYDNQYRNGYGQSSEDSYDRGG